MKNKEFVSNIVSPYYLHEIMLGTASVCGVLFKVRLNNRNLNSLTPHEDIDHVKVSRMVTNGSLFAELRNLPIMIGIHDDNIAATLKKYKLTGFVEITGVGHIEALNKAILRAENLILIDGHHRYAAARLAIALGKKVDLWCWVVTFNELNVYSFIKMFRLSNCKNAEISKLINHHYKVLQNISESNGNDLEIILYSNGYYYQLSFKGEDEFLDEMESLGNRLKHSGFILEIKQEIVDHKNAISVFNDAHGSCLVLKHSPITHAMILSTIKRGIVLPIHSTCFKPKPNYVSESLLKIDEFKFI